MTSTILHGNALEVLKTLPAESVNCCMTSPPYWGLRDYGVEGQLGLEPDFNQYISKLCDIFDEVKRVLRKDGTCWVNLGDTYYTKSGSNFENDNLNPKSAKEVYETTGLNTANAVRGLGLLPEKCLTLVPFRFAIEMVARGWILRNVIIWHKKSCMPSSASDRFTVDFEYLFFFVKSKKYWFEQQFEKQQECSVKRALSTNHLDIRKDIGKTEYAIHSLSQNKHFLKCQKKIAEGEQLVRNMRTTWTINPEPFSEAHFACYPEKLCEAPIKAGCPKDGTVLDPFCGSGTTGLVAKKLGRSFVGIELNPEYIKLANERINGFERKDWQAKRTHVRLNEI